MIVKSTVFLILFLFAMACAVYVAGKVRWQSTTQALHARLADKSDTPTSMPPYSSRELEGLPEPVQRYFRTVLSEGQRHVQSVHISHSGSFNLGEAAENWQPFSSSQTVLASPRGFIWDATIRMAPGLNVQVVDAYVAGTGVLEARLLGLITVMKQPESDQLNQSELLRFFAEGAWYPTALLPGNGVEWQAIDARQAKATLTDTGQRVSLTVRFNEAGLIESVYSEQRYRSVDEKQVLTPWEGRYWDYQERNGMLVPLSGEVAWLLPDGPKPYWRGRIRSIGYEYEQ